MEPAALVVFVAKSLDAKDDTSVAEFADGIMEVIGSGSSFTVLSNGSIKSESDDVFRIENHIPQPSLSSKPKEPDGSLSHPSPTSSVSVYVSVCDKRAEGVDDRFGVSKPDFSFSSGVFKELSISPLGEANCP